MKLNYDKILALLMRRSMSKEDLLEKAGISDFTLRSIMKGKSVRRSTAERVAEALGVTAEELEGEEEPVTEENQLAEPQDPVTEMLDAVKTFGDHEYQRGKAEMCDIFLKALKEAIARWNENEEDEA